MTTPTTFAEFSIVQKLVVDGKRQHPLMLLVGAQRHANLAHLLGECHGQFDRVHLFASFDETSGRREDAASEAQLDVLLRGATVHHGSLRAKDVGEIFKSQKQAMVASPDARNACLVVLRGFHHGAPFEKSHFVQNLITIGRQHNITTLVTTPKVAMFSEALHHNCDVFVTDPKQASDDFFTEQSRQQSAEFFATQQQQQQQTVPAAQSPSPPAATTVGIYGWLASWVSSSEAPAPPTTEETIQSPINPAPAPAPSCNLVWCRDNTVCLLTTRTEPRENLKPILTQ